MVVVPRLARRTKMFDAFTTVHDALCRKRIQGFICETVGTLEAVRLAGRKAYFTSIKPIVDVKTVAQGAQVLLTVNVGANHGQHPGLPNVLSERLELAFALGMRLLRAPRIGIPVPASFFEASVFADEVDIARSAARDNRWGDVVRRIEQRGVGFALLRSLQAEAGREREFACAVGEWADGDSVAAHVVYGNDVFCTEDQGRSVKGGSILGSANRLWLARTYDLKFATIQELASQIRSAQATSG
jgi:hypothetical protein